MWRFFTYFLGLAALALLAYLCVQRHTPDIQTDLVEQGESVLRKNGLVEWASVEVDGRDVYLLGDAPSEESRAQAVSLLENVDGVRSVQLKVTEPPVAAVEETPAVVETPVFVEPAAPAFPDPYQFNADFDGTKVVLSGHAPSPESRSIIVRSAEELFGGGNVSEQITVTQGKPEYWRVKTIQTVLASLTHHQQAQARFENNKLVLTGEIASPEMKEQIQNQLKQSLPEDYITEFEIVIAESIPQQPDIEPPVVAEPELEVTAAADCQQQFTQLLSEKRIHFKVALSEIDQGSMGLLDELAASAAGCEHAKVEISGHTDSSGDDMMNLELSHKRAQAVREALVARGIAAERLSVKGQGEGKPIADNSTPEGRALNRRIELNIPED